MRTLGSNSNLSFFKYFVSCNVEIGENDMPTVELPNKFGSSFPLLIIVSSTCFSDVANKEQRSLCLSFERLGASLYYRTLGFSF